MGTIGMPAYDEGYEDADDDMAEMRRSLPRPLMPLLEFLYSDAKYSQSSLSSWDTQSPDVMVANFWVR